jgi:signal transduction histidine kinase
MLGGFRMSDTVKKRLQAAAVVLLTAFSITIYYFIYYVWKSDTPFRFTYFLPSVLACLWWGRKGLPLLAGMGAVFFLLIAYSPVDTPVWDDIIGALVIMGVTMVIGELTERRNRLIDTLEERVVERTEELSVRNRELEAYGHTISHDLLGPVTIIKGYAVVAQENLREGKDDTAVESLDKIVEAANRMTSLTTSLLEYALAGSAKGSVERVDPAKVLKEALEEVGAFTQDEGGRVVIATDLPAIMVDPLKLRQVFANLAGNAIKYRSRQRSLIIEVGYTWKDGKITLFVRDNGEGMEPAEVREIFEPFKRLSRDTSPGAGIGLATVRRAVEGWGGRVWAESTPGKGSTFFFTAPAADPGIRAPGR